MVFALCHFCRLGQGRPPTLALPLKGGGKPYPADSRRVSPTLAFPFKGGGKLHPADSRRVSPTLALLLKGGGKGYAPVRLHGYVVVVLVVGKGETPGAQDDPFSARGEPVLIRRDKWETAGVVHSGYLTDRAVFHRQTKLMRRVHVAQRGMRMGTPFDFMRPRGVHERGHWTFCPRMRRREKIAEQPEGCF